MDIFGWIMHAVAAGIFIFGLSMDWRAALCGWVAGIVAVGGSHLIREGRAMRNQE